jgi:hypothetical protein
VIERTAGHHRDDAASVFVPLGLLTLPGEKFLERHQLFGGVRHSRDYTCHPSLSKPETEGRRPKGPATAAIRWNPEAAGAQEPHAAAGSCGQIHHQPARFDQRQNRSTQAEGGAAKSDIARFLNITVRELLRLRFPV